MKNVVKDYQSFLKYTLGKPEDCIKRHGRYVKWLLEKVGKFPGKVTEQDIRNFIAGQEPMSKSKKRNMISAFRVFFREYIGANDATKFKIPRSDPAPPKVPSKDEIRKFYDAIPDSRSRVMFLVYATSGIRTGEVTDLKMEDIDFK